MSELETLKARITRLEIELSNQRRTMIMEVRKMIDFHTHTLGGKVVWEFPPEVIKKGLQRMAETAKNAKEQSETEEKVSVSDEFKIIRKDASEEIV